MTATGTDIDEGRVYAALGTVWDPELGLDIVSLGLVYDVRIDNDAHVVEIDMTLTTPGCPVSSSMPAEAEYAVRNALGDDGDDVMNVVWDPPWTPERLTPRAMERLGFAPR
jgi:metal-sulfur cluster biosynthetic enzyme